MVMRDRETPRETHVLERGQYHQPREPVTPGVPEVLPPLPEGAPPNRLGLARWIVDPRNPLTARVAVNRYWQMLFGNGLVGTPENFGTRGELPTHPELLDWLAVEFRDGRVSRVEGREPEKTNIQHSTLNIEPPTATNDGERTTDRQDHSSHSSPSQDARDWSIKRMLRLIVTSATYRQSSAMDRETLARDPANRWLARGPRLRLPAETVRDQALAAAGLLDQRIGGPPVKPYQPEGLWQELVSFAPEYDQSHGSDLYRRSLYTFVRRTVPPPAMSAFDLPLRETCTVQRSRTNTPLQALVAMNDPTFVEAARVLAARVLEDGGSQPEQPLELAFRRILSRAPTAAERRTLLDALEHFRHQFQAEPERAQQLLDVGEWSEPAGPEAADIAAMTAIISLILNLDETLTRE
jgi:hypothetical protein